METKYGIRLLVLEELRNLDGPVQDELRKSIEEEGFFYMKKYDNFLAALEDRV